MTKKINDGGPAFPNGVCDSNTGSYYIVAGMFLRDYFAAKAMQGLLSNLNLGKDIMLNGKTVSVPQLAYMYADSMMQVREGKDDTIDKS